MRVVIKTRLVILRKAGARSTATHLRYIERDGVGRDGEPGKAYGPSSDDIDLSAFEARGRDDRHQFRFIVAPEDSTELDDLRSYTRSLMSRVEVDLSTRLDWVAVDHWDTGNPHIHLVLRGKDEAGHDLVIARDYIAFGMRARASELATEWLGPRTEREIQAALGREITQARWTGMDSRILMEVHEGMIDLRSRRPARVDGIDPAMLVGRLRHLETMGLAEKIEPMTWTLRSNAEPSLRALAERDDIVRRMQRALGNERRELAIESSHASKGVVGRIAGKGLVDELDDRGYLVVDGLDGRAHYVKLPPHADLGAYPVGGIVELSPATRPREVDQEIARIATGGIYRVDDHLKPENARTNSRRDLEVVTVSHVRRLEALRRIGIVERIGDGVWRVPDDLPEKAAALHVEQAGGTDVRLRSHWSIERQRRAIGATWLDQQLLAGTRIGESGFPGEVATALREREGFLVEQGFAERRGHQVIVRSNLLATLRERDVAAAGVQLSAKLGRVYRPSVDGRPLTGIYRETVVLSSGKFAVLDDGVGFSLVPWRHMIETRLGQTLRATVRQGSASFEFGWRRGPSI